jgi:hypothetical protein
MKCRIIVPFIASLALCASAAMAQEAPPAPPAGPMAHGAWHMNKEDMEMHHAQMCSDRYARAVGKLAYLEVKLALTDRQMPLFDRWKAIKLANVKARSAECASLKLPDMDKDFDIAGQLRLEEKMLKTRLADLQAEMPAIEALASTLNDEQKEIVERAGMHAMHERMEMMHGMDRHMMDRRGHDGGHDGPDADAPPSPPAQ